MRIELTTFGLRDRYSTIELLAQINYHGEDQSQYASCWLVTLIALILTNREIGWIGRDRTYDLMINSHPLLPTELLSNILLSETHDDDLPSKASRLMADHMAFLPNLRNSTMCL